MEEEKKDTTIHGNVGKFVNQPSIQGDLVIQGDRKVPRWLTAIPGFEEVLVGREEDLKELARMIEESKSVVLLNGMGGVGKTTLAIAYLDQFKDQYTHIAWLEQIGDFSDSILADDLLFKNLGLTPQGTDPQKDVQLVLNQLANLDGKCLLVLDNADKQMMLSFAKYLPKDWHVLITSREELGVRATLQLDFLDEENAIKLFYTHCDYLQDDDLVKEIIETIDYHTLSIELLAKTAAKKRNTLPLRKLWQQVKARGIKLGKSVNVSTTHSRLENIERIFPYLCSVFEVDQMDAEESWALKQFACLPPTYHSFDSLANWLQLEAAQKEALEETLNQLKTKGWLAYDKQVNAFKMHRILQEVVTGQMDISQEDVQGLLDNFSTMLRHDPKENPTHKFQWIPFAVQLLMSVKKEHTKEVAALMGNLAGVYRAHGKYDLALEFHQKSIDINETVLDGNHPDLATSYNNIARVYQAQGKYDLALEFHQKDIDICEALLDGKHPDLAPSYNNIAVVYEAQGKYEQALKFYQKSININEAVLDGGHPDLAASYNNIAGVYEAQGKYDLALEFHQKSIDIWKKVLDPDHPNLAASYNNIGLVYKAQGKYEQALENYQKSIDIKEKVLDWDHPDLAASYNNIAGVYEAHGKYDLALEFHQKSIDIKEAVLDADHPSLARSFNNLAGVYRAQGKYEEAKAYFEKSLATFEKALGGQHPHTKVVRNNLEVLKLEMKE